MLFSSAELAHLGIVENHPSMIGRFSIFLAKQMKKL